MHLQSIVPLSSHAFLPGRIRAVAALHLQFCMDGKGIRKMAEELVRRIRHLSASGLFSAQGQTGGNASSDLDYSSFSILND
jgi:hypothetical protein